MIKALLILTLSAPCFAQHMTWTTNDGCNTTTWNENGPSFTTAVYCAPKEKFIPPADAQNIQYWTGEITIPFVLDGQNTGAYLNLPPTLIPDLLPIEVRALIDSRNN